MTIDNLCATCATPKEMILVCPHGHDDAPLGISDKELQALLSELGSLRLYQRRSVFDELEREAALWAALKRVAPYLFAAEQDGGAGKGEPG